MCKERERNNLTGLWRFVQMVPVSAAAALFETADKLHSSVHQHGGEEVLTFLHNDLSLSVSLPRLPHNQTEEHLEESTQRSKRTHVGKDAVKSGR